MFTEELLLRLLKVQSNLTPKDFKQIFDKDRAEYYFQIFARDNWNLVSFLFNKINGEEREKLINYVNTKIA